MAEVQFVGDHFVLTIFVDAEGTPDEEAIIARANNILKEYYGWDVASVSNEIEVEEEE